MGDLSENSEYDEAKNAQAFLEGRIVQLEQQIRTAQIIVKGKRTALTLVLPLPSKIWKNT